MNVLYSDFKRIRLALALLASAIFSLHCTPAECSSNSDCASGYQCVNDSCILQSSGGGSAGGGAGGGSGGGTPVDTTPPTVSFASLSAGATVHGTTAVLAIATDNVGVSSLDFSVDGAVVSTVTAAPFSLQWNTTALANGAHTIAAAAHDAAGNTGSASLSLNVLNGAGISIHTRLGLPGPVVADGSDTNHYLSVKSEYVVSYDGARRQPNWVSWELNASWLGAAARQNDFRVDNTFPAIIPQASLNDYANSGYDRGHMCPSEDRTDTVIDNQATFYLTNMIPQLDNVNGGPWAQLEAYSRTLASAGRELFIVSGGVYAGVAKTIGADLVSVPSSSFKVMVVLNAPGDGVAQVTTASQVIAVNMPNDGSVAKSADWHAYETTAADIENQTGLEFFSDVDPAVRTSLEYQAPQ